MANPKKLQKVQKMLNEGKTDEEISKVTKVMPTKVKEYREKGIKPELLEDIKLDASELSLDSKPEVMTLDKPTTSKSTSETHKITDTFAPVSQPTTKVYSESELDDFRREMAQNISSFEAALYKGIVKEELPSSEVEMLQNAWYRLFKVIIKDANLGLVVAAIMLVTAHGTIFMLHREDITEGFKRIKGKPKAGKQDVIEMAKVATPNITLPPQPAKPLQTSEIPVQNAELAFANLQGDRIPVKKDG